MGMGALLRYRYWILTVWATAWALPTNLHYRSFITDYDLLFAGSRMLLGSPLAGAPQAGPLHLYAQIPAIQVGPPPMLLLGAVSWLPDNAGQVVWGLLIVACGLVLVRLLERYAVQVGMESRRAAVGVLTAGAGLMALWANFQHNLHLEDAVAITAIVGAVVAIQGRRPWWVPALLLGFAATCKPWAVMMLPLVLAVPSRDRLRAVGVAVMSAVVWWLPFIVGDSHTISALTRLPNSIAARSGLAAMGLPGPYAPQGIRSIELLLGICLAALTVLRGRWQAVPLVAFAARLLLEPRFYPYYGLGPLVAAVVWDVTRRRFPMWTVAVVLVEFVGQTWLPARWAATAQLVLGLAVVGTFTLTRPIRTQAPAGALARPRSVTPA